MTDSTSDVYLEIDKDNDLYLEVQSSGTNIIEIINSEKILASDIPEDITVSVTGVDVEDVNGLDNYLDNYSYLIDGGTP